MKRVNNLYYNICKLDHIRYIYDNVIYKNTKNKRKILNFDNYYMENIITIKRVLSNKSYLPGKYNIFLIHEPKVRIIMSQSIYDKIINHLVSYYILKPVIELLLIDSNVATRQNKGTDYGIKLCKKYINSIKMKYNKFYILKFDISKYFYNINHRVLKKLLISKIKDKDSLHIIFKIIDSTNSKYINEKSNCLNKFNIDIPIYEYGKGLPIGNMTSQILAIFYLNELYHFIKEELKIKYYIRYMDDGILIHHDKNYLKYCLSKIKDLVENKYKLKLNNKTKIYSIKEGFEFLGFRYYLKNKKKITKVVTSTKKRYKRKVKVLKHKDLKKYKQIIASYNGHLQYANSKNLIYEITTKI